MKALVGAFNQEKALVGAFSVILKTGCGTDGALHSTNIVCVQVLWPGARQQAGRPHPLLLEAVRGADQDGLRGAARGRGHQQPRLPPHLQADPLQRGEAQRRGLRLKYRIYTV